MTKHRNAVKSILDRSFRYTPSTQTDLRKTFARVRREQRQQQERSRLALGARPIILSLCIPIKAAAR